jgi:hypothetical protein
MRNGCESQAWNILPGSPDRKQVRARRRERIVDFWRPFAFESSQKRARQVSRELRTRDTRARPVRMDPNRGPILSVLRRFLREPVSITHQVRDRLRWRTIVVRLDESNHDLHLLECDFRANDLRLSRGNIGSRFQTMPWGSLLTVRYRWHPKYEDAFFDTHRQIRGIVYTQLSGSNLRS